MSKKYESAGVDIRRGEQAVELIKQSVESTYDENVISSLTQFAGIYKAGDNYLVASTDGVGTKLELANELDNHTSIGIDLVAMSVNDVIVHGARPLFFLDYLATGKIEPQKIKQIVQGVAEGCKRAGCSLLGGETAEMPGFYEGTTYDIAGFAVGIATKEELILDRDVPTEAHLIGIASSGPHSNGYSLIRKIIAENKLDLSSDYELGRPLGEILLEPTLIYKDVPEKLGFNTLALAHITGGGFYQNIARVLPEGVDAVIAKKSWAIPPVFNLLQKFGAVSEHEMFEVFNMGIGMVAVVKDPEKALSGLCPQFEAYLIGKTVSGQGKVSIE